MVDWARDDAEEEGVMPAGVGYAVRLGPSRPVSLEEFGRIAGRMTLLKLPPGASVSISGILAPRTEGKPDEFGEVVFIFAGPGKITGRLIRFEVAVLMAPDDVSMDRLNHAIDIAFSN